MNALENSEGFFTGAYKMNTLDLSNNVTLYNERYNSKTLRKWFINFIQNGGKLVGITYMKRSLPSIIHNEEARLFYII